MSVVLGLAAVDGLHVQGVAEDEGDLLLVAQVGEPVPGEHALAGDDDVGAEGRQHVEQQLLLGGHLLLQDDVAGLVEDADGQQPCVQIDAAVELVWLVVEAQFMVSLGWAGLEPAHGWDEKLVAGWSRSLIPIWDRFPPIPTRP